MQLVVTLLKEEGRALTTQLKIIRAFIPLHLLGQSPQSPESTGLQRASVGRKCQTEEKGFQLQLDMFQQRQTSAAEKQW